MPDGKCVFSGVEANVVTLSKYDGVSISSKEFGEYWITGEALRVYSGSNSLNKLENLLCLRESIIMNEDGLIPFWVVQGQTEYEKKEGNIAIRSIESVKKSGVEHKNKERTILATLAKKMATSLNPMNFTNLSRKERFMLGIFDDNEYIDWISSIANQSLIEFSRDAAIWYRERHKPGMDAKFLDSINEIDAFKLTVKGWERIYSQSLGRNSKNVFIAMAFTDPQKKKCDPTVRETIKETVASLGWMPIIVDEVEHNEGVMDKIVAEINQSRFIIAELTFQKSGVYYEAGYAKGMGLPVIHIVKKEDHSNCHFDVQHLNLIIWDSLDELKKRLSSRIRATIRN